MGRDIRIQLAGSYKTRNPDAYNFIARDHRYINYYRRTVVDPVTNAAKDRLEKRLGWYLADAVGGTRHGRSIISWLGAGTSKIAALFTATDGSDVNVYSNVPATGGTIATGSGPSGIGMYAFVTETIISGVATLLISINQTLANSLGYTCIGGGAPAAMGGTFPTDAIGPITPAYGFAFVMTRGGNLHNTPVNATTWAAADYIPVQSIPDGGVGAWRTGDNIAAFGTRSIEIFGNAGRDTNSPLLRVDGGVIPIGVSVPSLICDAGGMLAFVGTDYHTGTIGAYLLIGAQIKKISTPIQDNLLANLGGHTVSGPLASRAAVWTMNGEKILSIYFESNGVGLCLCCQLSNLFWFEYTSPKTILPSAACGERGFSLCVTAGNTSGNIYTMSDVELTSVSYQDAGGTPATVSSSVQVTGIDLGTNVDKALNSLELIGDTQPAASAHTIDISTDDAQNFTNVGTLDMNTQHRRLTGLGSFQKLGVKITHAVNGPSTLEALDLNVTKFGH